MKHSIPYGKQNITQDDIDAVVDVLHSNYLTQGPSIAEFETAFAEYVGSQFAIAVSNGTAALHLCALALDLNSGDKVITTPITFVASANCVKYCGGEVSFVDIDPNTYLIDIEKVRKLLESVPKGEYKGIIPVDFAGRPVRLNELKSLADEYGLWIIEDACHAPGGFFTDEDGLEQRCGNGNFADLSIFSFHPVKHIASGEGGMITTNDRVLYEKILKLRTHGITRDESIFSNSIDLASGVTNSETWPGWYMEMQELGFNYRLSDIQSALGLSQLKRAEQGIEKRREIAKKYFTSFKDKSFVLNQSGYIEGHAYHLYVIEVEDRLGLYNYLREKNIFAQIHYVPAHLMPYYQRMGWKKGDFPNAEKYYERCISLPMFPSITDGELDYVISSINEFYS